MREIGIVAWNWIAVGAIMGLLTVMIALGIGRRRGTWLHGLRLALWAIVVGGAGAAAGCSEQEITGQPDGIDTEPYEAFCYVDVGDMTPPDTGAPDTSVPDTAEEEGTGLDMIMCYSQVSDPDADADEPDETDAGEEADV